MSIPDIGGHFPFHFFTFLGWLRFTNGSMTIDRMKADVDSTTSGRATAASLA